MQILSRSFLQLLAPWMGLTLMGEGMLERILEDPNQPLLPTADQGYGLEGQETYRPGTSFLDLCRQGQAIGAGRLDVCYDFFFGGDRRENYPDSPLTVKAYKYIHDLARQHGMGFGASVISPLDTGGEYVKTHPNAGQTMQFLEGIIRPDGSYETTLDYQTQWTNNKGPAAVRFKEVKVFAFDEERIGLTPFYFVDEHQIEDISHTAHHHIDPASLRISKEGYGHGDIHIHGQTNCGKRRFLAVVIYNTLEIDYFTEDALDYMKSILDLHKAAGITYDGIYSDEMHIQFDWDTREHWGETEVTTRYMTDAMARTYADLYGAQYADFPKYLVYFTYMHHDFLGGEEGRLPAQHVFGKSREDIVRTFLFRKRYFDLLHSRVVDLCAEAKRYGETLFGHKLQATGHSTWQESPTTDTFHPWQDDRGALREVCRYDYTPGFGWSSAQRENISACNDHFKWNDYFWAVGTDIPEGGFLDRNYYGAALTSGLAVLNPAAFAYYCIWGAPDAVKERLVEVGQIYGHYAGYCNSYDIGHNMIQGCTARCSDILTLYPTDLNFLEERFGNWMVQYGYTDYITEDKLLVHAGQPKNGVLPVKDRAYRALVVTFSPLMGADTLGLLRQFIASGGTVIWCSAPALRSDGGEDRLWKEIFGIRAFGFDRRGIPAKGQQVHFGGLKTVKDMPILSDLFPDYIYPVVPGEAAAVATLADQTLGTVKSYPGSGKAIYMGFRLRDDQSCSTGVDVDSLFCLLQEMGCYSEGSCEAASRPADRRYIYNRFPNGTVSVANHFRTFPEQAWPWGFYRDAKKDNAFMEHIQMPPHDITLDGQEFCGHRIGYAGEGILTYRYDESAGLLGFAGRNTCGIRIDGKTYTFSSTPADITWGVLEAGLLDPSIRQAYLLKCSQETALTLPFDASGMQCCLCRNYTLEPTFPLSFTIENGQTRMAISPAEAGQWIVFYQ